MRLKLPKTEKGKGWTLRVVRRNPRIGGEEVWGYCDYDGRELVVSAETKKLGEARATLLHEALHKILPWLTEEAVEQVAVELDDLLDLAEAENILEL